MNHSFEIFVLLIMIAFPIVGFFWGAWLGSLLDPGPSQTFQRLTVREKLDQAEAIYDKLDAAAREQWRPTIEVIREAVRAYESQPTTTR
jgi:hypothetical protein